MPFDGNGMPIKQAFPVDCPLKVQEWIKNCEIASYVYTIMAQPIISNAPSFCLLMFGTGNKFNFNDVGRRWQVTEDKLRASGIEVMGYASDGDPRLLKAMKVKNRLGVSNNCPSDWKSFFFGEYAVEYPCVQDSIHVGNKLKNRFLSSEKEIKIGMLCTTILYFFSTLSVSLVFHLE